MTNATMIETLQTALERSEHVHVLFTTKKGTKRLMDCSRASTVPSEGRNEPKLNHPSIIAVYDHQNSAWRSFRKDSVINFEVK